MIFCQHVCVSLAGSDTRSTLISQHIHGGAAVGMLIYRGYHTPSMMQTPGSMQQKRPHNPYVPRSVNHAQPRLPDDVRMSRDVGIGLGAGPLSYSLRRTRCNLFYGSDSRAAYLYRIHEDPATGHGYGGKDAGTERASGYLTKHTELPYHGGQDKYTQQLQLETRSAL